MLSLVLASYGSQRFNTGYEIFQLQTKIQVDIQIGLIRSSVSIMLLFYGIE